MLPPPDGPKKIEVRTISGKEYNGYVSQADYDAIREALNGEPKSVEITINTHEDPSNEENYAQKIKFRSAALESVEDV